MKKRIITVSLIALAVVLAAVGTTMAYIAASSRPVINEFTVGNIELSLTETTGSSYPMVPGVAVTKDPRLTVKANSESCWLFFRMEKGADFDRYMICEAATGWTPLPDEEGVYYRRVERSASPTTFPLLAGDRVAVKTTVTESDLAAITERPTLTFSAYAVQTYGVETAEDAWQYLKEKGG